MKTVLDIADEVIGMTKEQAVAHIEAANFTARIKSVDGVPMMLTMEMCQDRINLAIDNNIVVETSIG